MPDVHEPVVVNLGKHKRRSVKRLKRGRGRLMEDVQDAIDHVVAGLPDADKDGAKIVPVVLVCQQKRRRGGRGLLKGF